jgi:hypothetical protein
VSSNGLSISAYAKTGDEISFSFSLSNAAWHVSVQINCLSFCNRFVRGVARLAYDSTNFL